MDIKKVGVVGCGLMGRGIVEVTAAAGYDVVVSEVNKDLLDKGMSAVRESLAKAAERGKLPEVEKDVIQNRIRGTLKLDDFNACDLVIEAAVENMDLKKKIFRDLDRICQPQAILATNTSCLSVTEIAAVTNRQQNVLGIHFFNPVPLMRLVELVKTINTGDDTLASARNYAEKLGKTVVVAPDVPGFIVNRLLASFLLEAIRLYESGQVTREDIDKAVRLGLNHPMGPLMLGDLIGLDTSLFICNAMYDEFKDDRFAPPILLKRMVSAGNLGRKSGKGFYDYTKK